MCSRQSPRKRIQGTPNKAPEPIPMTGHWRADGSAASGRFSVFAVMGAAQLGCSSRWFSQVHPHTSRLLLRLKPPVCNRYRVSSYQPPTLTFPIPRGWVFPEGASTGFSSRFLFLCLGFLRLSPSLPSGQAYSVMRLPVRPPPKVLLSSLPLPSQLGASECGSHGFQRLLSLFPFAVTRYQRVNLQLSGLPLSSHNQCAPTTVPEAPNKSPVDFVAEPSS